MERTEILELMDHIYTLDEAAQYLHMSVEKLSQYIVQKDIQPVKVSHDMMLFWKRDLDDWKEKQNSEYLDINQVSIRDVILYYTIQQYFHQSDKKTIEFLQQIEQFYQFDFHAGLKVNIPFLAAQLKTTDQAFYDCYVKVKKSFAMLPADVKILKKSDELYPPLLKETKEAPPFLFLRGNIDLLKEKSICVIGSRQADETAIEKTREVIKSLVDKHIIVNAGLAKGIDTIAHQSALEYGGQTIAVIGTPIHQYYPKENQHLQKEIEKKGLVISQYPPCQHVNQWNFPKRNATMSGISLGSIIMAAGEKSGTLKQADYALKQGREVVISANLVDDAMLQWPQKYIKKGAKVFQTVEDLYHIFDL